MLLEEFKHKVLPVKNKLYRFALRYLGNEDEAKDVVQEVLIKAWDRREELHVYRSIEAWCMQLTRNISLNKLKSGHYSKTDVLDDGLRLSYSAQSPYESAETQDTMNSLQKFMRHLPLLQQQVIQLRDVEGYTYDEISEQLDVSLGQVKINLFRARQNLKKNLQSINAYGITKN
ncbi:sigma-70 family RNA polymerase sigma factor [Porifericola rhodea]|uniref:RNA polymerase sigma factor n=1 Tax=Porifericola rhodea TaxID=930972 RepID=UPI0026671597|nr:sigma-70 family RNA polymerase sigma factor [Porifericola rhodea]WKN30238.1 sigma-70 family RNA polymerase sigma factor [Porifericola rhodea]